ncbi:hypothetical protein PsorP6_000984 [Peronosclerospora sorghi]|uniref:Uncharacterized protein n=1 Tax=Peronosclerospora sorghi TaxID=230839 RepID=A0ACC0WRG5_9STRA|nr:hypothetical protein PsorP6_000984 [Peronosclerospora sorghi]
MGGGSWVVQEGFLLRKRDEPAPLHPVEGTSRGGKWRSSKTGSPDDLQEVYVVLTMNRKLEFFDGSDAALRQKVDSAYLQGFAGWDGDGRLKVNAYGLELKVERNATSRMYLAALNRLDLEKWCRGFMAVLDPRSAPGEEIRRERRRVKKEEKRLQGEREEKIRKWKERKAEMIKREQDRVLAREEEISNMTPLERVDGLGSLDDDTARMLEKRKLRLQRRHAPTTGRVNKAAYRRRMEEAAGGKTDNVQPLHKKIVEQKAKIRVELPPPGQFFEVGGVGLNPIPMKPGSSGSDLSESSSISSRLSSISPAAGGSRYDGSAGFLPPPPPPLVWSTCSSREPKSSKSSKSSIPPPPPLPFEPHNFNDKESRLSRSSSSLRSASFDSFASDGDENSMASRSSFSQSRSLVSHVDKSKPDVHRKLATVLTGERSKASSRASRISNRRDSIASTTTSNPGRDQTPMTHSTHSRVREPSMANAFAVSLAAIRRNRSDPVVEETSVDSLTRSIATSQINGMPRDRKRDSQLSAEGKEILKKALSCDSMQDAKANANSGRRGLFDDSSSDDGSETGLFGSSGHKREARHSTSSAVKNVRSSESSVLIRSALAEKPMSAASVSDDEDSSSDSDSNKELSLFAESHKPPSQTPQSVVANNVGVGGAGPSVVVVFRMSAVRSGGKKMVGVFTFTLQFGNVEHTFSFTYAEFEAIHTRLRPIFPGIALPKFPSKHRLRNNIKPENMEKRAQELRLYLQQLVTLPEVVSNERFQLEYRIEGAFAEALTNDQKPEPNDAKLPRQNLASPVSSSRIASPHVQPTASRPSKGFFGFNDSDPESNSDTSIDTPKPLVLQPLRDSTASTPRKRSKKSEMASGVIASVPEGKKHRSQSRRSSRASSKASFVPPPPPEPPKPKATGLPAGRPNPFAGGRGDLLAAIRQGTQLKKTGDSVVSNSSQGLSTGKVQPQPAALTQPGSINEAISNAMAMRRIHVEYEETHLNAGSDSDDDWD